MAEQLKTPPSLFLPDIEDIEDEKIKRVCEEYNKAIEEFVTAVYSDVSRLHERLTVEEEEVPECFVYLGTNQNNLINDTYTIINLDTEIYDIGNNFNTTTHQFIVPVAGKYLINYSIGWTSASVIANKAYVGAVGAGVDSQYFIDYKHSALTDGYHNGKSVIGMFSKNDVITLQAKHKAGADTPDIQSGAAATYLNIRLLSED